MEKPCGDCRGRGRVRKKKKLTVKVPAGIEDGMQLVLRGEGEAGEFGGPPGDLFIVVHVSADPVFGRTADNVSVTVPVTFVEAALGADIPVPLPRGGTVTLKIPPGTATQHGEAP